MLAELARRIRVYRAAGGQVEEQGGEGEEEEDMPTRVIIGDDCQIQ